ncbi:hypothetical protein IKG33_00515 [Candidatus Saccharibacteria bacterium]|nr:hypothetical protein [Candidatus Saccharibacteria bacterium]
MSRIDIEDFNSRDNTNYEVSRSSFEKRGKKVLTALKLGVAALAAMASLGYFAKLNKEDQERNRPKTEAEWMDIMNESKGVHDVSLHYREDGSFAGVKLGENLSATFFDDDNNGTFESGVVRRNGTAQARDYPNGITLMGAINDANKIR